VWIGFSPIICRRWRNLSTFKRTGQSRSALPSIGTHNVTNSVAFGGKADMTLCGANVCLTQSGHLNGDKQRKSAIGDHLLLPAVKREAEEDWGR